LRRQLRDGGACDDAGKPSGSAYVISLLQKEFGRLAEKGNAAKSQLTGHVSISANKAFSELASRLPPRTVEPLEYAMVEIGEPLETKR